MWVLYNVHRLTSLSSQETGQFTDTACYLHYALDLWAIVTEAPGGISRKQHTQTSPAAAARIVASNFWAGVNSITVPRSSTGADIRYGLDVAGRRYPLRPARRRCRRRYPLRERPTFEGRRARRGGSRNPFLLATHS